MDMNGGITIALAICGKAPFLAEQLTSIDRQQVSPREIVIGDDSVPGRQREPAIPGDLSERVQVSYLRNPEPLGIIANFENVLRESHGDYIALCDQDDIWLPDKLGNAVNLIQDHEEGGQRPVLLHTDLELIDKKGNLIGRTFMREQGIRGGVADPLGVLLMQNMVTGASVVMNRALVEQALPFPPQAIMHDWWLALVAAATGQVIFDPVPGTQYRLHDQNAVGVSRLVSLENALRIMHPDRLGREFARVLSQDLALMGRHGKCLDEEFGAFMDCIPTGGADLLRASRNAGIRPQGLLRRLKCAVAMLSGQYSRYLEL